MRCRRDTTGHLHPSHLYEDITGEYIVNFEAAFDIDFGFKSASFSVEWAWDIRVVQPKSLRGHNDTERPPQLPK